MENLQSNLPKYAKKYSQLPIIGIRFLAYRDLPGLFEKFVTGTRALDYGCGPGQSSKFLKSLGFEVEGVDINEHMIQLAKEFDPNGKNSVINSGEIPSSYDNYDLAYAGIMLFYISSKAEMVKILKEVARVLKPGGVFAALVLNEGFYSCDWLEYSVDYEENKNPISGSRVIFHCKNYDYTCHHYYWDEEDYRDVIFRAGLELLCTHKPLGKDSDGYAWTNEKQVPMCTLYLAKNPSYNVTN